MNIKVPEKLEKLFTTDYERYVIHGGRSSGKSWGVALFIILCAFAGYFCVCSREIASAIDASSQKLITDTIYRCKAEGWFNITDSEITCKFSKGKIIFKGLKGGSKALTRTRLRSLEGCDVLWIEEGQSVTDESIIDIDKTVRGVTEDGKNRKIIVTMNPYEDPDPVMQFYSNYRPESVCFIEINIDDNPFAPDDKIKDSEYLKENDPVLWEHVYGGKSLSIRERTVITLDDYFQATKRAGDFKGAERLGVDVGRKKDRTVIAHRKGNALIDLITLKYTDNLTVQADEIAQYGKGIPAVVDDTGVGGGVTDALRRKKYPVQAVDFAQKPTDRKKFGDIVSEMYFNFADNIKTISLKPDDGLKKELTTRRYSWDKFGRREIESKEKYKKHAGGQSPDAADAVILAFKDYKTGAKKIYWE